MIEINEDLKKCSKCRIIPRNLTFIKNQNLKWIRSTMHSLPEEKYSDNRDRVKKYYLKYRDRIKEYQLETHDKINTRQRFILIINKRQISTSV